MTGQTGEKKVIAYAEDYPGIRDMMQMTLRKAYGETYNIEVFKDGDGLSKRLEKEAIGPSGLVVVLTDNNMPGAKGIEIIRKYSPQLLGVRFVLNTLDPVPADEFVRAGGYSMLEKPARIKKVIEVMNDALGISEE